MKGLERYGKEMASLKWTTPQVEVSVLPSRVCKDDRNRLLFKSHHDHKQCQKSYCIDKYDFIVHLCYNFICDTLD